MKPLSILISLSGALFMTSVPAAASIPMVDGVGSYTHSQVMRHRPDAGSKARTSRPTSSRAYRKSLMPEYNRRVRKYGKAPADRWLAGKVRAFEQQLRRTAPRR